MQLGLSEPLAGLVARRFVAAKEGNHLVFSSTHLSIITAAGIPYQLRYCPALAKKPINLQPAESGPKAPKPDPFENPSPDLLLAHFPPTNPTHALVLNKFPVIPNHFILATQDWKAQTDLLEPADLEATYECLRAWATSPSSSSSSSSPNKSIKPRLFAFFNSGDDSGASQPHRHLQFLPVEAMHRPDPEHPWTPLIDHFASLPHSPSSFQTLPALPFAHFALPLPPNPSPQTLFAIYTSLYHAAVAAARGLDPTLADSAGHPTSGPAAISYNLAMTTSTMLICPRRQENATVSVDLAAAGDVADPGVVSLNGTILAGTLMVKAEAEYDALRNKPGALERVLRDVGFPKGDERGTSVL
ncbi:ATP adenylyltransferase C-terminal [Penicillium macrosclerotiorum]|uniref:ATP adenylyltransferase C-terminal n=1 Tax=Penicillium macrosclerotiorum TaxID=303699 RepID=UPI0025467FD4|nr:ATP adenylyltransferase C-terminal [Penicillium macrosclerotiorum]KAJ5664642.1 ATP adenylyltransferase C-terminal [Penicillium macrosclerotiorum]